MTGGADWVSSLDLLVLNKAPRSASSNIEKMIALVNLLRMRMRKSLTPPAVLLRPKGRSEVDQNAGQHLSLSQPYQGKATRQWLKVGHRLLAKGRCRQC